MRRRKRKRRGRGNMGGERKLERECDGVSTCLEVSGCKFQTTGATSTLNRNKKLPTSSLSSCHVRVFVTPSL